MDLTLAGFLLGSAVGASFGEGPLNSRNRLLTTMLGGAVGRFSGATVSMLASAYHKHKLNKLVESLPSASNKELKNLKGAFKADLVDIYKQPDEAKRTFDNASYYDSLNTSGAPKQKVFGYGEFNKVAASNVYKKKDIRPDSEQPIDGALLIGRDYAKLPIVAHELGHASLDDKPWWARQHASTAANAISFGSSIAGLHFIGKKPGVALALLTAGALAGGASRAMELAEERRASRNALRVLKSVAPGQVDKARKALLRAYRTYDPVRFTDPKLD